jgi:hypothetical protein
MRPIPVIAHDPIGQAIIRRPNRTLKNMLIEQKKDLVSPKDGLKRALLTLGSLKVNETNSTIAKIHRISERTAELDQPIQVLIPK